MSSTCSSIPTGVAIDTECSFNYGCPYNRTFCLSLYVEFFGHWESCFLKRCICSQTLLNLLQLCKLRHDTSPFDLYKNKALIQLHKQWVLARSSTHCEDPIWAAVISILLIETDMLSHIDPTSLHGCINWDVSINLPPSTWCISFIFITTWPVLGLLQGLLQN